MARGVLHNKRLSLGVSAAAVVAAVATSAFAGSGREPVTMSVGPDKEGLALSGRCSKATALKVAKRFHLGVDPTLPKPIAQVLCGAFFGPGSEAMAASIAIPSCGRTAQWAVFRLAGGAWQLVMTRNNGADLAAVGSDIRETMFVLRPGDAHCFPTGGTRARVWHWNGQRFIVSAWKQVTPPRSGPTTVRIGYNFRSPSGNIGCSQGDEGMVHCTSFDLPHTVSLSHDGTVRICNGRKCLGPNPSTKVNPSVPVLAYGQQNKWAGFLCRSEKTGVTCTVQSGKGSGKGFLINRDGVRRVGP